jgi:hypothetical protein
LVPREKYNNTDQIEPHPSIGPSIYSSETQGHAIKI